MGGALAVALLVGVSASAYVLLSPVRTVSDPLDFIVDDRGHPNIGDFDGGATAVADAITAPEAWNGAGAGTLVLAQVGSVASFGLGDGVSMINFSDPIGVCSGSCLEGTFTGFYSSRSDGSYQIDEVDVVFNPAIDYTSQGEDPGGVGCVPWTEFYAESVAVHTVGHALGLGHTGISGNVMYPSIGSCGYAGAVIGTDDQSGLLALYGAAPCTDCLRHERVLGVGGAVVAPSGLYPSPAGVQRGWLEGTAGTDYDLELWQDLGSGYVRVAESAGGTSSEAIVFPGAAGDYAWVIRSSGGAGRYFFYQRSP